MQAERYSDDAVREVAESTAREFEYAHMKSEQLRVVEAFVQYKVATFLLYCQLAIYGYLWLFLIKGYLRLSCQITSLGSRPSPFTYYI